jgi:hypothetical protein
MLPVYVPTQERFRAPTALIRDGAPEFEYRNMSGEFEINACFPVGVSEYKEKI